MTQTLLSLTAAELEILKAAIFAQAMQATPAETPALAALHGRLMLASDELTLAAHEAATNGRKGGR